MDIGLTSSRQLSAVFETGRIDLEVLRPILEQHAAVIVDDAQNDWPVDTGTSRAAWEADVSIDQDALVVGLFNNARLRGRGYSVFIHRAGTRQLTWTEVLERLTLNLIPSLQADIALTLAEEIRR